MDLPSLVVGVQVPKANNLPKRKGKRRKMTVIRYLNQKSPRNKRIKDRREDWLRGLELSTTKDLAAPVRFGGA